MGAVNVRLGIDVGTQGVRAVTVADDGTLVSRGRAPLTSRRSPGRHEQDPEQWWRSTVTAIRECRQQAPDAHVAGIAVCATSGTVLAVDARHRPLGPALMYDDLRAADRAEQLDRLGAVVWERNGYLRIQPAWALPRLLWLAEHTDAVPGRRLEHQTDFVNARLIGTPVATDLSSALKSGADLQDGTWPEEVLSKAGLDAALLPTLVRPGQPLGVLGRAAAEATGLTAGTTVHAGATDGCASALAVGIDAPGDWCSVLGTTLVLKGISDSPVKDPSGAVYSHPAPGGLWLPGGASSSGAGLFGDLLAGRDLDRLTAELPATLDPGLVTYPLAGIGERFPFVAPKAHAFSTRPPVDDIEALSGLLLGVASIERLCLDYLSGLGLPVDGELVLVGGATRNHRLNRLRASLLGRPVRVATETEPAAGAARLAGGPESHPVQPAGEVVEPGARGAAAAGYLTLLDQLQRRGWLGDDLYQHARTRATDD